MYYASKVELPIFVDIATFLASLITGVHHIINLTSQTKLSGYLYYTIVW